MATYTWVDSGGSVSGTWGQGTPPLTPSVITIPPGGILKRFLGIQHMVAGEQDGPNKNNVGMVQFNQVVQADVRPRPIFQRSVAIPPNIVPFNLGVPAAQLFIQYVNAGDEILEFNQQCSYGKHTNTFSWDLHYKPSISWVTGYNATFTGEINWTFSALYETL